MPFWKRKKRPFQATPDESEDNESPAYLHSLKALPKERDGKLPTLPRDYESNRRGERPDVSADRDHVLIQCPKCASLLRVNRRNVIGGFPCPSCHTQLALSAEQLFPTHQTLPSFRIADGRKESAGHEEEREGVASAKPNRNWEAAVQSFTGQEDVITVSWWRKMWNDLLIYLHLREPPERIYVVQEGSIEESARRILESGAINREGLDEEIGIAPASTYRFRKSIQAPEPVEDEDTNASEFSTYAPSAYEAEEDEDKYGDARFHPGQKEAFSENWEGVDHIPGEEFEAPPKPSWFAKTLDSFSATRWLVKEGAVQWVLLGAIVTLLGVAGLATTFALVDRQGARTATDAYDERLRWTMAERAQFRKTAIAYAEAPNIEAMLKHVWSPDRVKPLMEAHYQKHKVNPAEGADVVDETWAHRDRAEYAAVEVLGKFSGQSRKIVLISTPDGWKVNWEVSERYEPISIGELTKNLPREPVEMPFLIERSKYHNWQFSDSDKFHSFKLIFPSGNGVIHGYALKDSSVGRVLDRLLGDFESAGVVINVRYPEEIHDDRMVIIDQFIRKNWVEVDDTDTVSASPEFPQEEATP